MVEVKLWGALSASVGGNGYVNIEAKDIRELFSRLAKEYPAAEPYLKKGIAVSIDGVIYRDSWATKLPENAEIFLLPRMTGG